MFRRGVAVPPHIDCSGFCGICVWGWVFAIIANPVKAGGAKPWVALEPSPVAEDKIGCMV